MFDGYGFAETAFAVGADGHQALPGFARSFEADQDFGALDSFFAFPQFDCAADLEATFAVSFAVNLQSDFDGSAFADAGKYLIRSEQG